MTRLNNGQRFPNLKIQAVGGGGTIKIPEVLHGSYGVVLIYRGSWCPYCNAQLAGFERAMGKLGELGVKVVAFSAEDETKTSALAQKHGLTFTLGHSADVSAVARTTGAYVNDKPRYLQTTGFLLTPDGEVLVAVYSSSAIGRLVADDVAGMVAHVKSKSQ